MEGTSNVFTVENYLYFTRLIIGVVLCYLLYINFPELPFSVVFGFSCCRYFAG